MEDAGLNLVRGGDGCGIALTCLVMSFAFVLCLLYLYFVFFILYLCQPRWGWLGCRGKRGKGKMSGGHQAT